MKTRVQQFPHIYRFLTAGVYFVVQKYASLPSDKKQFIVSSLPFVIIILYLVFSVFAPASDFERVRLAVQRNPKNAQAHMALSQIYKKYNDLEMASQELFLAMRLSPNNEEIKTGIASLVALKTKPGKLQNELDYWQKISLLKPNYRDAFLQKAILFYQLKNTARAKINLQKALELDPNYEYALETKRLLEKK